MSTLVSESSDKQTIFVLRHGDRYDFNMGSEAWGLIAQRENDPPLSDMGLAQTVDNGIWARGKCTFTYVSFDWLRTKETE